MKQTKKPKKNNNRPIADLVIEELEWRKAMGKKKYGTYLQANNGRCALRDAFEECVDMACYLMQALEEKRLKSKRK
jgi:hypothetical protein